MTLRHYGSHNDFFGFLLDATLVFFGVWTIVHEIAYFAGLSFRLNWNSALIAGLLSVLAFGRQIKRHPDLLPETLSIQTQFVLWISILAAVSLTICLYRPDADDEFYLGLSVLSLDFMDKPIKSLPILKESAYAITSYDFLRGAFSYYTGVPLLRAYFLFIPGFFSALVIICQYRLYRLAGVQNIPLALISFFVIMLAWGDVHRSPPNIGFVKLFQGKGLLLWISIPASLYYWLRYHVTQNKTYLILLFLASASAVGASATGIPITFLLLLLTAGSSLASNTVLLRDRKFMRLLLVGLASLALVAIIILTAFRPHSSGIHTSQGMRPLHSFSDYIVNIEMLRFVLGDSARAVFALFSLVLTPFILGDTPYRKPFAFYVTGCCLLILFPFTSALSGLYMNASMSWRWLFLIPFLPSMVLLIDRLYIQVNRTYGKLAWGLPTWTLALFYWTSYPIVSEFNHTRFLFPQAKLPDLQKIVLRYYPDVHAHTEGPYLVSPITGKLH